MGIFDWLGPTSLTKRRGWDHLPAPAAPEKKLYEYAYGYPAITFPAGGMLIHGPGASEILSSDGGATGNSAVFSALMALSTAFFEAPLRVAQLDPEGERESWVPEHPLQALVDTPNPWMNERELWFWICWSLHATGNAYVQKVRSGDAVRGNVIELWPRSTQIIEPRTVRDTEFISYYRRDLGDGKYEDIPVENMLHFKLGIDDRDHRKGLSPIKRLVRQIATDEQAAAFEDRLLRNFAVPGTVVTVPQETMLTQEQADELKQRIHHAYSGESLGYTGVLTGGAKLDRVSFTPDEMALDEIHKFLESRICAVLRVPPAVVNLLVGLEQTSNYASARILFEAFTERTLIPLWSMVAAKLNQQLRRDFRLDRRLRAEFDLTGVRSLQEDENAKFERVSLAVEKKWMLRNEARADVGLPPIDGWDDEDMAPPAPPVAAESMPDEDEMPADEDMRPAAASRGRPHIVTLPMTRKAIGDLPGRYERLRDDLHPAWEDALRNYLRLQLRRVSVSLRAGRLDADDLVPDGEAVLLGETLTPLQLSLLGEVHGLVLAELGIAFQLDDPTTRLYLRLAGQNIAGITETTRDAVRAALLEGQAAGEGVDALARRLRALPAFSRQRARTVARTELAVASNEAALANYKASAVVSGVVVFDGDYDAECAAMNGRTFPLYQTPPMTAHPNCRRAFAPVVEAGVLGQPA